MRKKTGLVIAAADGIMSLQSGVGVVVNFFFESFHEIKDRLAETDIDLYAMCPRVNRGVKDYCEAALHIVQTKCAMYNGRVVPLDSLSSGDTLNEIWKGTAQYSASDMWESCCVGLANKVNELSKSYDTIYLIVHDTLFVNVSTYIKEQNIKICWIPHSLGTLFEDPNQPERIAFEKCKIRRLIERGDKIGYISNYTKDHLFRYYNIEKQDVISFYSGIYFNSQKYNSASRIHDFLETHQISKNKKLIFTWGRCSDQKGIDIVLNSYYSVLKQNENFKDRFHLVLICPTETTYEKYWDEIQVCKNSLPGDSYTFIDKFQESLQYDVLSYKETGMVLLCSRYESFGLTSIEALHKSNNYAKIIYSPLPTFNEVFENVPNAVQLEKNTAENLQKEILSAINYKWEESDSEAVQKNIKSRFNIVDNYSNGLSELFAL